MIWMQDGLLSLFGQCFDAEVSDLDHFGPTLNIAQAPSRTMLMLRLMFSNGFSSSIAYTRSLFRRLRLHVSPYHSLEEQCSGLAA